MRTGTIKLSDIADHPFHSLAFDDYFPDDHYIRKLLENFSSSNKTRLCWMIRTGRLSVDHLVECEKQWEEVIAQKLINERFARIRKSVESVLDEVKNVDHADK